MTFLAFAALLSFAPKGEAAFSTPQCQGADTIGRGASFARDAHGAFKLNFQFGFCNSAGAFPNVSYEALGSGAGRRAVGERSKPNENGSLSRNQPPRFGMTDEPPSTTGQAQMNQGTDAPGDEGIINVVPAAVGSVTPLVNFPNDCDVNLLAAGDKTVEQDLDGDSVSDDVVRVKFTKAKFDAAWAKEPTADTWTELFTELAPDADCNKPIIRVVRFDDSGTSFAFKDYLDNANAARNWIPDFVTPDTRTWPNATVGPRPDCNPTTPPTGPGSEADATDQLTSGCANGNGPLVSKLIATDGSIGYSDISTARTASPSLAVEAEKNDNDTYWTQIQNGSNAFTESTADPNGFRTDGSRGANCQNTTFTGVPSSTKGNWAPVSGVNSPQGFGICTLTYGLVFDDNADAYGTGPGEESKARSVKDYWTSIVSDGGQSVLFPSDYAPLPASILALARTGIGAVDWNKGSGPGPGPGPGPGTTPKPAPAIPSNVFSIPRRAISSKTGRATLSVRVPGAGRITVLVRAKNGRKRFTVANIRRFASKAQTVKITIRPSRTARKILKRKGKLKCSVKVTYQPNGGTARSSTKSLTLKLKKKRRRR